MNQSWKKRIAMLSGGAAMGMATLAFASPASADVNCNHQQYPDFSYGSYYGYPNRPMTRHEQQHDTNRNGRLEPWEHEQLHQHEAQAQAAAYYRRPYVRYRTRPAWSWSWTFGW